MDTKNKNSKIKDKTKWIAGAGIFSTVLASLCCITPILAVLTGLSGFATMFSFFEPFRPVFIAMTILLLGYLWYKVYRNSKMECACNSFWESKKGVLLITFMVVVIFSIPYISRFILGQSSISSILIAQEKQIKTYTLHIEGMTCTGCEVAIITRVQKITGVQEIQANHKTGKGFIRLDANKTNIKQIINAIEELGYKVIQYDEI